ncbi:MAG: glycosyltransferase family 39 protein, partial [Clostridia bacterium]|nr:glycosyltransferase family 39 protein [Clostridia bacterium]
MTRKKRIALIALVAALALAAAAALAAALWPRASVDETKNLIVNGGFEASGGGLPDNWAVGRWYWDEGVSYLTLSDDAFTGEASVCVENVAENDARFEQTVAVEPNAYYRISCMVKAEGCGMERAGAGISIENTFVSSNYAYDTAGEWTRVELYGRTGASQKSLTIMCRVGGYSSLNVGKAWFDDVEVVRLAALPGGVVEKSLATNAPSGSQAGDGQASNYAMPVMLASALFAAAALALTLWARRHPFDGKKSAAILAAALAVGVAARVVLAVAVRGFEVDVNCFEGWADRMAQFGPWGFYGAGWCDYPPGYMLILWPFGLIRGLFGIAYNSRLHWLLVKLPPIACDVLTGLFLAKISREKLGESGAAWLGAAYLLNPAVVFNSAIWGQVDSVLTLLLLVSVYCAARREWRWSLAVFAFAALCKPQALMFAPLGVMALACEIASAGEDRKKTLIDIGSAVLIAAGVMLAVALPFSLGQGRDPVTWLWARYTESLGEYNYITVNACNLYQLMGMNWKALDAAGPWTYLGWFTYPAAFGLAVWFHIKGGNRKNLFLLCAMALTVIYAFGTKMHERYLYPAVGLLLAAYAVDRDARELICAIALSASLFANEALVLGDTYLTDSRAAAGLASFVNVEAAQLLGWTAWDICVRGRRVELKAMLDGVFERSVPVRGDSGLRLTLRDWAIMLSVTAAYAVLAFVNLGSTKAPQTAWTSSASGESVTFALESRSEFRLTYYGGICNSSFTVAFSDDGVTWSEEELAMYDQGQIFRWIWFTPQARGDDGKFVALDEEGPMRTAKYVRVTAEQTGLVLHEIAFLDPDGNPLPITSVHSAGGGARAGDPALLCDEQDTVPAYPSYYNSSYFDEIYHARTGYEFAHGLNPYETTHPPLGKVLIMLGIKIFGMTPFGWRFMGALFGVLMLPLMYLLVKQLLKKTEYAALGMALLALDSMHFTQTRIATIDTYGVFFILLMYLFMFRYCQMNFYTDGLKKTLIPLGLSGVAMGLGIASKWICIYAAVG